MRSDVLVIVTCDGQDGCLGREEIRVNPLLHIQHQIDRQLLVIGWTVVDTGGLRARSL